MREGRREEGREGGKEGGREEGCRLYVIVLHTMLLRSVSWDHKEVEMWKV